MLDHRGRRSGAVRRVVLETVGREGDAVYVVSGYGSRAHWLRNIEADPRVRLWLGWGGGRSARAEIVAPAASRAVLERYRQRHPRAARALGRLLNLDPLTDGRPLPDVSDHLPVVRITRRAATQAASRTPCAGRTSTLPRKRGA